MSETQKSESHIYGHIEAIVSEILDSFANDSANFYRGDVARSRVYESQSYRKLCEILVHLETINAILENRVVQLLSLNHLITIR